MSVTQVHEALGSFEFELLGNVPREVLDEIDHFDHIAVIPGRIDPRQYNDGCLAAARYVGVVRRKKIADDGRTNLIQDDIRISGVGLEFWLGDDDGKGYVFETSQTFTGASFTTAMNTLRPTSVGSGTIYTVTGTYTGNHIYETPRDAIKYVCDTMSTAVAPVGYRVNNDVTLDAGPESSLFVTTPTCIVMRKGATQGEDMFIRALPSTVDMDIDMEDFATRVVMLAEADGASLTTGTADIATVSPGTNIYKDKFGNALTLTKMVNETDTLEANADTRAALALRSVISPHRTLSISTDDFDIHGSFKVGDYIYIYDPDSGLVDLANETYIRGVRINPLKLRVTEMNFPITEGYTVAHRDKDGVWTDLTDYIHWEETQPSQVVIGDFNRDLTNADNTTGVRTGGTATPANLSIPDVVTWITPFTTANYLDGNGTAKASITAAWNTPLNTDATGISDGDRYELNVRLNGDTVWTAYNVAWGTNSLKFNDLSVAKTYEFRIRAFDTGNNDGAWSSTQSQVSSSDTIAPSTPAAPVVATSTIAVQVSHSLGKASGGTFNLETDLAALEVHLSTVNNFTPSASSYIGDMRANNGMMAASATAIQTFQVANTVAVYIKVIAVDTSGNRSAASTQGTTTATLVDSAHISALVVDKVSAGTISANWLLGASIRTAASGARVELNNNGIQAYSSGGTQTVNIASADGSVTVMGQIISGTTGRRLEINPTATLLPELRFYPNTGSNYSFINATSSGTGSDLGMNSGDFLDTGTLLYHRIWMTGSQSRYEVVRADTSVTQGGYMLLQQDSIQAGYSSGGSEKGKFLALSTVARVTFLNSGVDGGVMEARTDRATIGYNDGTSSSSNRMELLQNRTRHIGKWANYISVDSNEGIFTGSISSAGSVSGVIVTWGPTMDSPMYPVATVRDSPANYVYNSATPTTTSTSLDFAIATTGASAVQFWCWRM